MHGHSHLYRSPPDDRPVADRRALPGSPSATSVKNVPIPSHDHVVGTRNGGLPEWWNVQVIATTDPATFKHPDQRERHQRRRGRHKGGVGSDEHVPLLPGSSRHGAGCPGGQPDRDGPSGTGGGHRTDTGTVGQPDRDGDDLQQPEERLRRNRTELPEPRHLEGLDRRPERGSALLGAVLLRYLGELGLLVRL